MGGVVVRVLAVLASFSWVSYWLASHHFFGGLASSVLVELNEKSLVSILLVPTHRTVLPFSIFDLLERVQGSEDGAPLLGVRQRSFILKQWVRERGFAIGIVLRGHSGARGMGEDD